MKYNTGEDLRHLWAQMDRPERVGTCSKLRQGQLLMQRYHYTYNHGKNHNLYADKALVCKEKAIRLAAMMQEHSTNCNICCDERVLEEPLYYGVYNDSANER
jgi:hypothetical protein